MTRENFLYAQSRKLGKRSLNSFLRRARQGLV